MKSICRIFIILLTVFSVAPLCADVSVSGIFSNNAVLQIGPKTPVWGLAIPGEAVTVTLGGISAATVTKPDGTWRVELPLNTANAIPQNLVIQGANTLTITNVLVGEVWLCSGQSNMWRELYATTGGTKEIALSNNPSIRHFDTITSESPTPLTNQSGSWSVASPATSGKFTAVGYYFAKKLNAELGVPVAIINSSVGGTAIQKWISIEAFGWNSDLKAYRDIPSTDCSRLFNGMIAPWAGYGIRGVNWYQGETNANAGDSSAFYRSALMVIIQDWRRWWGQGDLFFNICQLSTYTVKITDANDGQLWPAIRESQFQASKIIPNAEIANLIDLGEADIHPKNKKDVGDRLVLNALARVYSRTLVHRGPIYKSMSIEGSKIRIAFDHADLGLVAKPVPTWYWLSSAAKTTAPIVRNSPASQLEGFAIRSASGVWVWANATIVGNTVLVESTAVPSPTAVRYAWNNNPTCNLYNGAGLPTVAFRTDQPSLIVLPVAVSQSVSTLQDSSMPITLNGTDLGSSPLTFSIFSPPSRGSLSGTPPNVIYTPAPNTTGPDAFSFVVNNGTINSVPASVTIAVTPSAYLYLTWTGNGIDANWGTPQNWADNAVLSGPTAIPYTFAGNTQNTSNNDLSGLVASDFNFTNTASVGNTSPFVLSGNTMTVQNISTTASSSVIADTINFNINTSATGTYDINTNHHLTINGNISGGIGLIKNGLGTLIFSGNNDYNGVIAIQQGAISVSSIADVGSGNPSSIGSGNLRMGNASSGVGTLLYTGSGATTARTVQIGNGAGTSGAIILATGANGGNGLKFTAPTFNTPDTDATNNARSLTLSGPNTDENTISGIIQNAKTSGVLNLVKDGNGKWILGGVNTYTGNTTVSGGTLQLSGSGKLGGGSYSGILAIASGATFQYGASGGGQTLSGVVGTGGGNLSMTGSGDLILSNAANAYGTLNISAGRVFIANTGALPTTATVALAGGTLDFNAAGTYNNAITVSSGAGIAARRLTILNNVTLPSSGSVILNNDNDPTVGLTVTKNQILSGPLSIQVGGGNATVGTAALSGIMSGGSGAITKMGTGTLTLSGVNTYTGVTTVSAGTLAMGASNVLPATAVSIGSATLNAATFTDTVGTLGVTGSAIINLGVGAALTFNDSRAIDWSGGMLTITGTFVSGSSLRIGTSSSGLTGTQLSQISKPGGGAVTLDDSGFLIALPATSYTSWASTNASGTTSAQDKDNDGVPNAVEYVLGGDVLTNDLSKLPVLSSSGGNVLFTFKRTQTSITATTALRVQVGTTLHTWPDSYTVGADTVSSSAGVTVLKGVPAGFDTITLSVPKASASQKFIRLNVNITP